MNRGPITEQQLRDALVQAVNGNPISADDAWALLHAWDDLALRIEEIRARALDETLPHDERLLAIEKVTRG